MNWAAFYRMSALKQDFLADVQMVRNTTSRKARCSRCYNITSGNVSEEVLL